MADKVAKTGTCHPTNPSWKFQRTRRSMSTASDTSMGAFSISSKISCGLHEFLSMFVVALTIAAGLIVGDTISRPQTTL